MPGSWTLGTNEAELVGYRGDEVSSERLSSVLPGVIANGFDRAAAQLTGKSLVDA